MRIYLEFVPEQSLLHRSRLEYAFRLFCAIYGHQPIMEAGMSASADVWLTYATKCKKDIAVCQLGNMYRPRPLRQPAPAPNPFSACGESTMLFYPPEAGSPPDWLGEIFEWVSCADEYSIVQRDSVGRVPFHASYYGRHGLDPRQPYAAVAMRLLQHALRVSGAVTPTEPASPVPSSTHLVVNTHDVDFLPVSHFSSVRRLLKNSLISLLLYRSPALAWGQLLKAARTAFDGNNPLDQLLALAREEARQTVRASYFLLTEHRHARDGNYDISDPEIRYNLRSLLELGMDLGVHGSYTSLDAPEDLEREYQSLQKCGFQPSGGRQHWLRFTVERLIAGVARAKAPFDASLGWQDRPGFRAGACFAFPPYDFARERSAVFLEIPLVIMDETLLRVGREQAQWYESAESVLAQSRRYGWGGISILWHPTAFGGGQLPAEIGVVFWRLLKNAASWNDTWLSGADFLRIVGKRYREAGLLAN